MVASLRFHTREGPEIKLKNVASGQELTLPWSAAI